MQRFSERIRVDKLRRDSSFVISGKESPGGDSKKVEQEGLQA
jgi:hypothetical protein